MPLEVTLTIGPKSQAKLQPLVDAHNHSSGSNLTLEEWIVFSLNTWSLGTELVDYMAQEEARLSDKKGAELDSLMKVKEAELWASTDLTGESGVSHG